MIEPRHCRRRTLPGIRERDFPTRWFCLSCQAWSFPTDDSIGEAAGQKCERCGQVRTLILRAVIPRDARRLPRRTKKVLP